MTPRQKFFEMRCTEVRNGLSARLDGETDLSESAALQAHLDECADCSAYDSEMRELHEHLRENLTDSCNPDMIWERVEWAIAAEESGLPKNEEAPRRSWLQTSMLQGCAAAMMAAMLLIGVIFGGLQLMQPSANNLPVITETIRDFETFRLRGGLLDVAASEPNVVRNWMAAKIDFDLPRDVTPPAGFKIAGGRLCSFLNRRLAFFHYEKGPSALSVYVMRASGLDLPRGKDLSTARSSQGLTTVIGQAGGLVYVVVSDLPETEAVAFATRLMTRGNIHGGERS